MPGVLFFDLARRCGVAHDSATPGVPKTYLLTLPRTEGSKEDGWSVGPVFAALRAHIASLIPLLKPALIGFEAYIPVMGRNTPAERHQTSQVTIEFLYGLISVTQEVAAAHKIDAYAASIQSIKKYITGDGRADKADVIRAVQRLGWDIGTPPDDNRADAAAGWAQLSSILNPKFAIKSTPLFARAV